MAQAEVQRLSKDDERSPQLGELTFPLIVLAVTSIYLWDVHDIGQADTNLLLILPVSAIVLVLALAVIVGALLPAKREMPSAPDQDRPDVVGPGAEEEQVFDRTAIAWVTLFAAYLAALALIDFLIVTPVYLFALMRFLGVRSPKVIAMTVLGVTGGSYLVFVEFLSVGLP